MFPYDHLSNYTHCFFIVKKFVTIITFKAFLDFNSTWASFYVKLMPFNLQVHFILCSKGVVKGKPYTFFQFLAITEIKYFFLIIWLPENVPKFVLLFNHQIFDLASKQKSKNLKVTCLGKSPELLNFLLHFNLLQKRTTNSIISTFSSILYWRSNIFRYCQI